MSGRRCARGSRSILLRTTTIGVDAAASSPATSRSPATTPALASTTRTATSASARAARAVSTMRRLSGECALWMPGVSMNTACPSGVLRIPTTRVRVVCGFGVTMATFVPTRAFSSVDFPTLGRPTMATVPARCAITLPPSSRALRVGPREGRERLHRRRLLRRLLAVPHATPVHLPGDAQLGDEALGVVRAALLHQLVDRRCPEQPLRELLEPGLVVAEPGRRLGGEVGGEVGLDQAARRLVARVEVDGAENRFVHGGQ